MIRCPVDGTRMWSKDALHYGCHHGHVMAKNAVIPPADHPQVATTHEVVPTRRRWQDPRLGWVAAAALVLAQVVEVLL